VEDPIEADRDLVVAGRRGCDISPIDATSFDGRTTLMSYIWPDEAERIARMRAAIRVAETNRPVVDKESADTWLSRMLGSSPDGSVRLIWQSVMAQYLTSENRSAVAGCIEEAGSRANGSGPLVYARMEPATEPVPSFQVSVSCWPGGIEAVQAHAGDHGPPVRWIGEEIELGVGT
jgi:hypothetical protein